MSITVIAVAASPEQIRRTQELRRSAAAQRHANAKRVGVKRKRARNAARRAWIAEGWK
jgi:hypothetical protein